MISFYNNVENSFCFRQWDTFFAILWPHDPILWKTDLAPIGAFEAALLADKKAPLPSYLTEKAGSLCLY